MSFFPKSHEAGGQEVALVSFPLATILSGRNDEITARFPFPQCGLSAWLFLKLPLALTVSVSALNVTAPKNHSGRRGEFIKAVGFRRRCRGVDNGLCVATRVIPHLVTKVSNTSSAFPTQK